MKKTVVFVICFVMLFNIFIIPSEALTKLTFRDMYKLAEENSSDLSAAGIDIINKSKKIKEAKKYVSDQTKKSWWLFSRKYQYPKIFSIKTKLAEAEFKKFMATKEETFVIEKLHYELDKLYTEIFMTNVRLGRKKILLQKAESRHKNALMQLKAGIIEQMSVDEVAELIETIKQEKITLEDYLLDLKVEMSGYIDRDVTRGYYFDMKFIYLDPDLVPLQLLILKALESNTTIYKMNQDIGYTTKKVEIIRELYNDEFSGSRMSSLNRLASLGYENIKTIDLASSYIQFEKQIVAKWGDDWKSYWGIDLFFFEIKIPKFFRFGEFDGVRFLDDGRYAYMSEGFELMKKIKQKETLERKITLIIKKNYLNLQNTAKNYNKKKKDFVDMNRLYEINQKKYDAHLIEADELIANKEKIQELDADIFDLLVEMTTILKELNYQTGGFLTPYLNGEKPLSDLSKEAPFLPKEMEAGGIDVKAIKALAEANKPKGIKWMLKPVAKNMSSEFLLEVKGDFDFDSYALFTIDGKPIGVKTELKKGVTHLKLVLEDKEQIIVKFYKGDDFITNGVMGGYGTGGDIVLKAGGES